MFDQFPKSGYAAYALNLADKAKDQTPDAYSAEELLLHHCCTFELVRLDL